MRRDGTWVLLWWVRVVLALDTTNPRETDADMRGYAPCRRCDAHRHACSGGPATIITGAAGDIGRACAVRLAAEGAPLVLGDLDAEGLEATAAAVQGEAVSMAGDVTSSADVRAWVDAAAERFGGIGAVAHCAGITGPIAGP